MKKKLPIILLAIFLFLIISNKFTLLVQGQASPTPSQALAPQMWRCLKAEQVGGQTAVPPPEVDVSVTGAGFPSLHDIYVALCVPPGEGAPNYRCTTGNSESDELIFNSDLTGDVAPLTLEVPKGTTPPQKIQAIGDKVNTLLHMSNATGHVSYAFFGVTVNEPQLISGQASTIQYGTFQFEQNVDECVSIRWDPYGRVFDSLSLEPISGVRVSLLDKDKQILKLTGLVNPQRTKADGQFNFLISVKKGETDTFYLNPVPLAPLPHTFTATPNLHPNYVKVYSDIYKPDEPIVEAAGIQEHRDIPLDPGASPPFSSNPVVMSAAHVKLGKLTRYEGTISHPFSIVTLVGKNSRKEVARTNADRTGAWEILIPNDKIPQNEALKVELIKVDLTTLSRNPHGSSISRAIYQLLSAFIQGVLPVKVSAQDTDSMGSSVEFQPILSYVEGYAYDQNGSVIPNAKVNVKLDMTDKVYYQVTADSNGFFTIPPQNLPIFPYHLEFVSANAAVSAKNTAAEFAQKNEKHLTENNVDLMSAEKNGQSLFPTRMVESTSGGEQPTPDRPNSTLFAGNNLTLIMTVIALVVLLGVAGGVLIYIKKKESQTGDIL